MAEGIGSCNSMEGRYRWRDAKRSCPSCGSAAIIKGKAEYGGGWVCFKKQGGCGKNFQDGDQSIESQPLGKIENDDPYTLANTILKMAQKRAHVAATLNATGASRIFTQDVEDMGDLAPSAPSSQPRQEASPPAPERKQPQRQAPPQEPPSAYVEAEVVEKPQEKASKPPMSRDQIEQWYLATLGKCRDLGVDDEFLTPLDDQWKLEELQAAAKLLQALYAQAKQPAPVA
jgi:hypothetical protein